MMIYFPGPLLALMYGRKAGSVCAKLGLLFAVQLPKVEGARTKCGSSVLADFCLLSWHLQLEIVIPWNEIKRLIVN